MLLLLGVALNAAVNVPVWEEIELFCQVDELVLQLPPLVAVPVKFTPVLLGGTPTEREAGENV
jgi:hypothetical protein